MIVGCYSMHLYCDVLADGCHSRASIKFSGGPAEFTGQNERECRREARKAGWRPDTRKVVCPACRMAPTALQQESTAPTSPPASQSSSAVKALT